MTDVNSSDLPPLRETIARLGLDARKSLGQHFLLDLNITRKIVRLAGICGTDNVVEIGPGPGGLTRAILETGAHLVAIEKDQRAISALAELQDAYGADKLSLIEGDALAINEHQVTTAPVRILSNLPYNISTELLIKWLRMNHAPGALTFWSGMALMFQKEVADRILAAPGSKTYGRLSVIAQAASKPRRGFDLAASAFTPPPKVKSTVVLFDPSPEKLMDLMRLEEITKATFGQRRKMLRTSLKSVFGGAVEDALANADIDPTARAEDVPVSGYIQLAIDGTSH